MPALSLGIAGDTPDFTSLVSLEASLNNPVDDVIVTVISVGFVDNSTCTINFPNSSGVKMVIQVEAGKSAREHYAANQPETMSDAVIATNRLPGIQLYNGINLQCFGIGISPVNTFTDGVRIRSSNTRAEYYGCTQLGGAAMLRAENINGECWGYSCVALGTTNSSFRQRSNGVGLYVNCDAQGAGDFGFRRETGGSMTVNNCRSFGSANGDFNGAGMLGDFNVSGDATAPGATNYRNETEAVHYESATDAHWPAATDPTAYPGVAPDGVWDFDWDVEARSAPNQVGSDFVGGAPPVTGVTTLVNTQIRPGSLTGRGGLAR